MFTAEQFNYLVSNLPSFKKGKKNPKEQKKRKIKFNQDQSDDEEQNHIKQSQFLNVSSVVFRLSRWGDSAFPYSPSRILTIALFCSTDIIIEAKIHHRLALTMMSQIQQQRCQKCQSTRRLLLYLTIDQLQIYRILSLQDLERHNFQAHNRIC